MSSDVLSQNVGEKRPVLMQGIYRLAGDNLVICYDSEMGRCRRHSPRTRRPKSC